MRRLIIGGIIIIGGLILGIRIYYRNTVETIIIKAYYMQYACGDDNIDMNVISVENRNYNFVLKKDISPKTNFLSQHRLIDFIDTKTLKWQRGEAGDYLQDFTLIGHLKNNDVKVDCSAPMTFYVDKIRYGDENEFIVF